MAAGARGKARPGPAPPLAGFIQPRAVGAGQGGAGRAVSHVPEGLVRGGWVLGGEAGPSAPSASRRLRGTESGVMPGSSDSRLCSMSYAGLR